MKGRMYLAIVLLGLLAGCGEDDPKKVEVPFMRLWENQVLQSELLGRSIEYAVLLPEGYDESNELYPVVYLLHGYGDDETTWYKNGGLRSYVDKYSAETGPMIFVMPQGFRTYYIDKYNGNFPYMDMFVEELVPEIDARLRTRRDKSQRAVMGYSMGGYGALILPAMHPEVFSVGIPLSMSFRTDEQYLEESQSSFDNQWAPNFGPGQGVSGTARLSDYFKERSPFYFFNEENLTIYNNLKFLIDCGDDEESLIFTSNSLHSLMRGNGIAHEYRVRSGGHSFDYWKKSYPEALTFISNAFNGIPHPAEPEPAPLGTLITDTDFEETEIEGVDVTIMKPLDYETSGLEYPVLYFVHDGEGNHHDNLINTFSLLRNAMTASKLTQSIVVEIDIDILGSDDDYLQQLVTSMDQNYRTKEIRDNRVIMANGSASTNGLAFADDTDLFSDCFIFNAQLSEEAASVSETVFYYIDGTDKSASFKGYENLYSRIRNDGTDGYEYRIRQGAESYQAFLNGLNESLSSLKESLSR
jgi:enterochelin esterase-like enzyme